jgi:ABC-type multidrug transport system fused ATPase/permease subunit
MSIDLPNSSLFMANFPNRYTSIFLWFISTSLALLGPLLIQQLIICAVVPAKPSGPQAAKYWEDAIKATTGGIPLFTTNLYVLAVYFFFTKLGQTLFGRTADQMTHGMALNIKTALIGAIYQKSLRLGVQGVARFDKGYILNLVNVDTEAASSFSNNIGFRS